MHRAQEQIRDFHRACDVARPPGILRYGMSKEEGDLRERLIEEEFDELKKARAQRDVIGQIHELCDLVYVVYGYAVALGVDLEPFFEEVHRANMEKAPGPKRIDGKQLKPEGWRPAHLLPAFNRQEHIFNREEMGQ